MSTCQQKEIVMPIGLACIGLWEWGKSFFLRTLLLIERIKFKATCKQSRRQESSNWQHEWCLLGHVCRIGPFTEIFIEYHSSSDVDDRVGEEKLAEQRKKEDIGARLRNCMG